MNIEGWPQRRLWTDFLRLPGVYVARFEQSVKVGWSLDTWDRMYALERENGPIDDATVFVIPAGNQSVGQHRSSCFAIEQAALAWLNDATPPFTKGSEWFKREQYVLARAAVSRQRAHAQEIAYPMFHPLRAVPTCGRSVAQYLAGTA